MNYGAFVALVLVAVWWQYNRYQGGSSFSDFYYPSRGETLPPPPVSGPSPERQAGITRFPFYPSF